MSAAERGSPLLERISPVHDVAGSWAWRRLDSTGGMLVSVPSCGMLPLSPEMLAPGDGKSAALDPAQFRWNRICRADEPAFSEAFEALWAEFGAAHEMEPRGVLAARFALGLSMRYEMITAHAAGDLAAVRDHTAIWAGDEVVVHLSHVLVRFRWRRTGLAGWLRAAPLIGARELAAARGLPEAPVTMVCEMEPDDGLDARRSIRLAAYERAGFAKVGGLEYFQPDFRPPEEIDAAGGARPLPFQLIVRQVGRDRERSVTGARVRHWVRALYGMYGAQFRAEDMAHPLLRLDRFPADDAIVPLIRPTQP
jgi:hypothetical protein